MIERRLTVLVAENGSVEILPSRSGDQASAAGHRWLSIILLCCGFLIGSVLCLSALLGLLFTSKTQRPSCLQWLTLAALLDTIQGHLFGAAFLATRPADLSSATDQGHLFPARSADLSSADANRHVWCSLSAALSLSLLLAQAGYTAALAVQVKSEPRATFYRRACYAVLPLVISMTVAVEGYCWAPVNYFPHRNGCGFVNISSSTVWQPHKVLALATLCASSLITISGLLGRQDQHDSLPRNKTDKTVLKTLTALFVLLVMPYSVLTIVTTFSNANYRYRDDKFGYETFFTWLRYLYNNLLPITVLMCYKDVRKEGKFSLLMFWMRKNNAVHECSRTKDAGFSTKLNIRSRKKRSKHVREKTNPEVPVLFTTAKGLFLRTVLSTGKTSVLGSENFTDVEKTVLCEPCDFSLFDTNSRAPSRCQSYHIMTPDSTKDSTVVYESSAAKRRNVVRFSEEVIELPAAAESGVWSDPREEMTATRTVKSSLGSTYTKLK
ncbi:hypothetical protein LSTR_LSTR011345 [Laodelphax striatellus]|uniref:G-protein coupled receptors family 1 profile domain-containing protein n=1 Tax=Laodelphax striatellus TaxID=195883 RepID=A0A482XRC8_LAOST|nr:hypothetical protein LSTR_LSTR011345 [Laodelphax striatellus]